MSEDHGFRLTKEEGYELVCGFLKGWEHVEEPEIYETDRWTLSYYGVFIHVESGRVFSTCWRVGATEMQDEHAFEYDAPVLTEMVRKTITKEVWTDKE